LAHSGGAALIIDYGHAGPVAGDTLQAVRGHRFAPVLEGPGTADLTAHVDFTALAEAARAAGARSFGPLTQAEFLGRLGIGQRAATLKVRATPAQAADIESAFQRLTDVTARGTLFKVLALAGGQPDLPAGFTEPTPPSPAPKPLPETP
jgi:NADH dehydrogenase [ubiquinone] 1 alpha subcomplex assembly factor 7